MNIDEAKKQIVEYSHLIGSYDGEDEITDLVIVPSNADNLNDILACSASGEPYEHFLTGYGDFLIFAVFNDLPLGGALLWKRLDQIV